MTRNILHITDSFSRNQTFCWKILEVSKSQSALLTKHFLPLNFLIQLCQADWLNIDCPPYISMFNCCLNWADIYFFKFNNGNVRIMCEICSKLTIKAPELLYKNSFWCLYYWLWTDFTHFSGVSIVYSWISVREILTSNENDVAI